jgi:hypothetical protein
MDTDLPVLPEELPSGIVEPAVEPAPVVEVDVPRVESDDLGVRVSSSGVSSPGVSSPGVSSLGVSDSRGYPSLYDTKSSTVVAILLGMLIVGGIQGVVWQIHQKARTEYSALTQFVTMMVALVLGAYMADLLIAGPDTSLLSDDEHTIILGFVKDICLMVFSYYFGTRSASSAKAE